MRRVFTQQKVSFLVPNGDGRFSYSIGSPVLIAENLIVNGKASLLFNG